MLYDAFTAVVAQGGFSAGAVTAGGECGQAFLQEPLSPDSHCAA